MIVTDEWLFDEDRLNANSTHNFKVDKHEINTHSSSEPA